MLTDHYNLQGFIRNKRLKGKLGCWWGTLSGYHLDIVYQTGKTDLADRLSSRPDYKAAAEVEDSWKQAEEQTGDSPKGAQSSVAESEKSRKEVARISTA